MEMRDRQTLASCREWKKKLSLWVCFVVLGLRTKKCLEAETAPTQNAWPAHTIDDDGATDSRVNSRPQRIFFSSSGNNNTKPTLGTGQVSAGLSGPPFTRDVISPDPHLIVPVGRVDHGRAVSTFRP